MVCLWFFVSLLVMTCVQPNHGVESKNGWHCFFFSLKFWFWMLQMSIKNILPRVMKWENWKNWGFHKNRGNHRNKLSNLAKSLYLVLKISEKLVSWKTLKIGRNRRFLQHHHSWELILDLFIVLNTFALYPNLGPKVCDQFWLILFAVVRVWEHFVQSTQSS